MYLSQDNSLKVFLTLFKYYIYEGHSIIKDTNSYRGKIVDEKVMIFSEQLVSP